MEDSKVSVIVPCYNVEPYLDRCMESIMNQTYQNLEVIVINDGSTDGTEEKALRWSNVDSRIRVISQGNSGLGPARTRGAQEAQGEYLSFIDSDDWIHEEFIERLVARAQETGAELVYCNVLRVWLDESGGIQKKSELQYPYLETGRCEAEACPEVVNGCGGWTWNKLYQRRLWKELGLRQPANAVEDVCTTFVLLIKAKGVAQVTGEPLYYYVQREGSLSRGSHYGQMFLNAVEEAKKNMQKYGIPKKFQFYVGKMVGESLSYAKLQLGESLGKPGQAKEMEQKFHEAFGGWESQKSVIFGSFSLRCIAKESFYEIPSYYGFSSLISAMSRRGVTEGNEEVPRHGQALRQEALRREWKGEFQKELEERGGELEYLVFDMLEERYGVIELEDGRFVTASEAYEESRQGGLEALKVLRSIETGEGERQKLWEESCRRLEECLERSGFHGQMILVKTRLSETYGDREWRRTYPEEEAIQRTNEEIKELEERFLSHFKRAKVLEVSEGEDYYTYSHYTYGCNPWHLNSGAYARAGRELRKLIEEEEAKRERERKAGGCQKR